MTVTLLLFGIAFLCFILSSFGSFRGQPYGPSLVPLGLAFWILALIIQLLPR